MRISVTIAVAVEVALGGLLFQSTLWAADPQKPSDSSKTDSAAGKPANVTAAPQGGSSSAATPKGATLKKPTAKKRVKYEDFIKEVKLTPRTFAPLTPSVT